MKAMAQFGPQRYFIQLFRQQNMKGILNSQQNRFNLTLIYQVMNNPQKFFDETAKAKWQFGYLVPDSGAKCQEAQDEELANKEFSEFHEEAQKMQAEQAQHFLKFPEQATVKEKPNISDDEGSSFLPESEQQSSVGKMIKQSDTPSDSLGEREQSSFSCRQPKKTKKIYHKSKEPYPTKNFLPVFKPFFINYIERRCPNASQNKAIKKMKGKKCVNCRDFQRLFNQEQFRPVLAQYFRQQQIQRDLLQSRVSYKLKRKYFERIGVFKKAFRTRKFKRIN